VRNLPIAALILVLAGWLVYSELSREAPKEHVHENQAQPAGNATREIEQLQREVDANPNDHGKLLQLANMLHDQGLSGDLRFLPRAIDAYKSYLSKHPEEGNPRVDLGICYFEWAKVDTANAAGLIHMAIQEMTTVFEANPRHQAAAFNLGIVTLSSGQSLLSNEWFKRAVDIDPESELGKRARNIMEQHTFSE
jgi:thioredoxin-like negative regulator of GroEL